jgi:hypothetical protein
MKECGTCTKCCEGWVAATINGYNMHPGKPCYFLEINKGCTIYADRPENPCKEFFCVWIRKEELGEELKPENNGIISSKRGIRDSDITYLQITPAPNDPDRDYLDLMKKYNENLFWTTKNKPYWEGTEEFCKIMESRYSPESILKQAIKNAENDKIRLDEFMSKHNGERK